MALERDQIILGRLFNNDWTDEDVFEDVMTEEGLCFTFNGLNYGKTSENWDLESGYNHSIPIDSDTYPFRVFGSGAKMDLTVTLAAYEKHAEHTCRGFVRGYRILLHTPGEVPQMSRYFFRLTELQDLQLSVKPSMITTSKGLKYYDPNK